MTKHEAAREIVRQEGDCEGVECSDCPMNPRNCDISNNNTDVKEWLAANPEQKESSMKYKIDPIPGLPEWFMPGIVCRVRDREGEAWHGPVAIDSFDRNCEVQARFLDSSGNLWRYAEPVEQWKPQEGEWVAAWDEGTRFIVTKYEHLDFNGRHATKGCSWRHVARLQYPDGRVIDCACDVEELKNRTDWI